MTFQKELLDAALEEYNSKWNNENPYLKLFLWTHLLFFTPMKRTQAACSTSQYFNTGFIEDVVIIAIADTDLQYTGAIDVWSEGLSPLGGL